MSAEHVILNKMKEATYMFIKTLNTIKTTAVEIEQIAKNEIDNGNCSIENNKSGRMLLSMIIITLTIVFIISNRH
jgi:hypothetical protein